MQLRPLNILLVEDNDDHAELVATSLGQMPIRCRLVRFASAEATLGYLSDVLSENDPASQPDLILLDLYLPGMSGLECLKELRSRPQTIAVPVVVLSASDRRRDIAAAYRLGASSYIVKPGTLDEFVVKLAEMTMYWTLTAEMPEREPALAK